jgi:predicted nuclease with TOPRIM domain
MNYDKEMEAALIADGEKLRALTGEDHGPWFGDEYGQLIPDTDHLHAEVAELREQLATARAQLAAAQTELETLRQERATMVEDLLYYQRLALP